MIWAQEKGGIKVNHLSLRDVLNGLEFSGTYQVGLIGVSHDLGHGRVFGGQIIAQVIAVAYGYLGHEGEDDATPDTWTLHSLHGYFLRPALAKDVLAFTVRWVRVGRRFRTAEIECRQNSKVIAIFMASLQLRYQGLSYQKNWTGDVPSADKCKPDYEWLESLEAQKFYGPLALKSLKRRRPFEVRRPIPPPGMSGSSLSQAWIRVAEPDLLDGIPNFFVHALLGYVSDYDLMGVALGPHQMTYWQKSTEVTSRDHALWILDEPFSFADWVLLEAETTQSGGGRGLTNGRFYREDGKLIASVSQEGVIRQRSDG